MSEALAVTWSDEQINLIKTTLVPAGCSNAELALFINTSKRLGLDPFARQIYAVKRWNAQAGREVMQTQVSVDGFRVIAERAGDYAGQRGPEWCGADGLWRDVWLDSKPPSAARVGVLRKSFSEPLWGVARFEAYKQTKKDGGLAGLWSKMPDVMLAKCAECLALRRAFPNQLGGVYSPEEMQQAEPSNDEAIPVAVVDPPAKKPRTVKMKGLETPPPYVENAAPMTPERQREGLLGEIHRFVTINLVPDPPKPRTVEQVEAVKLKRASILADCFNGASTMAEVESLELEALNEGLDKLSHMVLIAQQADSDENKVPF